eukprot:PhF_6_TR3470/c0_g1_i2/m.5083
MSMQSSRRPYVKPVTEQLSINMMRSTTTIPWGLTLTEEHWKAHIIKPGSIAERSGLQPGDVIVTVNQTPVSSPSVKELMGRELRLALVIERLVQQGGNTTGGGGSVPTTPRAVASTTQPLPPQTQSVSAPAPKPTQDRDPYLIKLQTTIAEEDFQRKKMLNSETASRAELLAAIQKLPPPPPSLELVSQRKRAEHDDTMRRVRQKRLLERNVLEEMITCVFGGPPPHPSFIQYVSSV